MYNPLVKSMFSKKLGKKHDWGSVLEGQNGEKRSAVQIVADEVSPSVRWATAQVSKNDFEGGGQRPAQTNAPSAGSDFGAGYEIPDEEPF